MADETLRRADETPIARQGDADDADASAEGGTGVAAAGDRRTTADSDDAGLQGPRLEPESRAIPPDPMETLDHLQQVDVGSFDGGATPAPGIPTGSGGGSGLADQITGGTGDPGSIHTGSTLKDPDALYDELAGQGTGSGHTGLDPASLGYLDLSQGGHEGGGATGAPPLQEGMGSDLLSQGKAPSGPTEYREVTNWDGSVRLEPVLPEYKSPEEKKDEEKGFWEKVGDWLFGGSGSGTQGSGGSTGPAQLKKWEDENKLTTGEEEGIPVRDPAEVDVIVSGDRTPTQDNQNYIGSTPQFAGSPPPADPHPEIDDHAQVIDKQTADQIVETQVWGSKTPTSPPGEEAESPTIGPGSPLTAEESPTTGAQEPNVGVKTDGPDSVSSASGDDQPTETLSVKTDGDPAVSNTIGDDAQLREADPIMGSGAGRASDLPGELAASSGDEPMAALREDEPVAPVVDATTSSAAPPPPPPPVTDEAPTLDLPISPAEADSASIAGSFEAEAQLEIPGAPPADDGEDQPGTPDE